MTPDRPLYREFHYVVQQTSDLAEVINLIDQVFKSYPNIKPGPIGRFISELFPEHL